MKKYLVFPLFLTALVGCGKKEDTQQPQVQEPNTPVVEQPKTEVLPSMFNFGGFRFNVTSNSTVALAKTLSFNTDIVVPETVTYKGTTLTVTEIISGAFSESGIETVYVPATVKTIEANSFDGNNITELTLAGDTYVAQNAFAGSKFRKLTLGANRYTKDTFAGNLPTYNDPCWQDGSTLEKYTLELIFLDTVTKISPYAFYRFPISYLDLGNGIEEIGSYAFNFSFQLADTNTTLNIPSSLRIIEDYAFGTNEVFGDANYKNISFPADSKLEEIGIGAFMSQFDFIDSIVFPSSLRYIGPFAFTSQFKNITLNEGLEYIGSFFIYPNRNSMAGSVTEEIVIPSTVKYIENGAFTAFFNTKKVVIKTNQIEVKPNSSGTLGGEMKNPFGIFETNGALIYAPQGFKIVGVSSNTSFYRDIKDL